MKHDILINPEAPFASCKLNRKIYADVLTEVVVCNKEGFVMALNSGWGTGKTTFVKMWQYHLELEGLKTIYFNAWENDFEDNALTALVGELNPIVIPASQESFKKVLKSGLMISKHILPAIVKGLISKHIDSESIREVLDEITDDSKDLFKQEVEEYGNRKEQIKEFKLSLAKFIADTAGPNPIVFIVDELDRCRPSYAVSLLEQIKHFFSVPNIVFVLSMNKGQLEHAIKGTYGSENIDADEYLRRFIDIEYSLPTPDANLFADYLYEYYQLSEVFEGKHSEMIGNDKTSFLRVIHFVFKRKEITLRQQEKVFAHIATVLKTCLDKRQIFPVLFVTLVYLKLIHRDIYNNIRIKSYSIGQLQKKLLAVFPKNEDEIGDLIAIESIMIVFYSKFLDPNLQLIKYSDHSGQKYLEFPSAYDDIRLMKALCSLMEARYNFQVDSIDKIIARIDLLSRD